MGDLLANYSITEMITFLVMFAAALKGVITFWDWAVERLKKVFYKEHQRECTHNSLKECIQENTIQIKELSERQSQVLEELKSIKDDIKLLTEADQADIKAWITEKHHHFCYEQKYIDDYNLDCIERRYHYYVLEGGNSFIKDLMKEIRALPKTPSSDK